MLISNKKGQSLVEVMVSLTLLAFVLSGSILLIITVVNLAMESRTKTAVVTFAQSSLATAVSLAGSGCYVSASAGVPKDYPGDSNGADIKSTSTITPSVDYPGLQTITVVVEWTPVRSTTKQTYTVSQLIRTVGD